MADYDGSIRINTQIDTKNASSQMLRLENQISKAAKKAADLTEKMRQMENQKMRYIDPLLNLINYYSGSRK